MSPEAAVALVLVVVVVAGVGIWLVIRKLSRSKSLMQVTRITAERAQVRAQAAEDKAERLTTVAENAVNVGTAMSHAERCARVAEVLALQINGKVDLLLGGNVYDDPANPTGRGKHRAEAEIHVLHPNDKRRSA